MLRRRHLPRQQVLNRRDMPLATPRGADAPGIQGFGNGPAVCLERRLLADDGVQAVLAESVETSLWSRRDARMGWAYRNS